MLFSGVLGRPITMGFGVRPALLGLTKDNVTFLKDPKCRHKSTANESLVGRHFMTLKDFDKSEIIQLLWTAKDLKHRYKENKEVSFKPLISKSIATIFQKRSTRTRFSTESGMGLLGGQSVFLGPDDVHIGVYESVSDTARVLSSMCDLILARVRTQSDLDELASSSSVPVISGMSDMYHPLQILADLLTLHEHYGSIRGLRLAFVGDGNNNITHSLMMGCPPFGIDVVVASPKGYEVHPQVLKDAEQLCSKHGTSVSCVADPREAVAGVNVVVTDTYVSHTSQDEFVKRAKDFQGFQVNKKLVELAVDDYVFLHCLPRQEKDVSDDVFYDEKHSLVWTEAENRKWTVMSVMLHLLQPYTPVTSKPLFD